MQYLLLVIGGMMKTPYHFSVKYTNGSTSDLDGFVPSTTSSSSYECILWCAAVSQARYLAATNTSPLNFSFLLRVVHRVIKNLVGSIKISDVYSSGLVRVSWIPTDWFVVFAIQSSKLAASGILGDIYGIDCDQFDIIFCQSICILRKLMPWYFQTFYYMTKIKLFKPAAE